MRQISLFQQSKVSQNDKRQNKIRHEHGGKNSLQRKRKLRRPLDSKKPAHLILKSSKARDPISMLRPRNRNWIATLIRAKAIAFNIQLQGYANVGNHLHLKIKFACREDFQRFLRSITSLIARHVTGARKGKKFGKFWDWLAYTKIVAVWKYEKWLNHYIVANNIEAECGRAQREQYLAKHKNSS